jgi:hypothetical protein
LLSSLSNLLGDVQTHPPHPLHDLAILMLARVNEWRKWRQIKLSMVKRFGGKKKHIFP